MNDNVVDLPVDTTLDLEPDRILEQAKGDLEVCIILGVDKNGEDYIVTSISDAAEIAFLLDRLKFKILMDCVIPDG